MEGSTKLIWHAYIIHDNDLYGKHENTSRLTQLFPKDESVKIRGRGIFWQKTSWEYKKSHGTIHTY